MALVKVIEVLAESKKSWEDAVNSAVEEAAKTIKNIRSVYVQEQSVVVKNDKVAGYRVNVKITFELDRK